MKLKTSLLLALMTVAGSGLIGACSGPDDVVAVGTTPGCITCAELVADWSKPYLTYGLDDLCSPHERAAYEAVYACMNDHIPECSQGDPDTICVPLQNGMFAPPCPECRACLVSVGCENTLLECGL